MGTKSPRVLMFTVVVMLSGVVSAANAAVSTWPMEGGNRFHTRSTSIVGPTVPVLKWSVDVGGWRCGEPSIGLDGNIYVGGTNVYLTAVSPSGSVVWQRTDHFGALTPAVGANGNLYTNLTLPGRIACLNSNGDLLWSKPYDWGIVKSPMIGADGSVYFHYGKYTPDGEQIGPAFPMCGCATSVSEGHGSAPDIYTRHRHCISGTTLRAWYLGLNEQNEPVWKTRWSGDWSSYTNMAPSVCSDGTVIAHAIVNDDSSLVRAYSPLGDLLWSLDVGHCGSGATGVAIGSDSAIYAVGGKKVHAINPDGSTRWTSNMGVYESASPVVDGADTVYYRTISSLIAVGSDGSTKWVLSLPGQGPSPIFGNDGTMYIGVGGSLYAYDAALRLLAPNGGEDIMAGSTYTIQWDTEGEISDVLIEYSTNNGADWTAVDQPNVGNTGSYEWDPVPVADSNDCLVRISDASDAAVYDTSDGVFTIFVCQSALIGDIVNDCYVGLYDLIAVANQWIQAPGDPSADIAPPGGDGVVNLMDVALLAGHWLECGNPFDPTCGL